MARYQEKQQSKEAFFSPIKSSKTDWPSAESLGNGLHRNVVKIFSLMKNFWKNNCLKKTR